jgi:hypothetical protein
MFSVSIHLVDRAFGGPEEGGWWFDYGEPDGEFWSYTRLFATEEEAVEYGETLNPVIRRLNRGRPEISSVLSKGEYRWVIQDGYPHVWPHSKPHYE